MRAIRILLPSIVALAAAASALADPPVAATIPEPQPVAATIAQPATTVSPADVNGAAAATNYGAQADTKMICKTETPIGSHLGGHRVCMTKADWEKQARSAQDYMNARIGASTNSH